MALRKEEITRKLLHLFALVMPVGIFTFQNGRFLHIFLWPFYLLF